MNPPLTMLIAGFVPDRPGSGTAAVYVALRHVIRELGKKCKADNATLRLLTGVSSGVEVEAASVASDEALCLHLLAPGLPSSLTEPQTCAERQVWLGAELPDFDTDEPSVLRDQIALDFSDVLLVVWDGSIAPGSIGQTSRLVVLAALSMKPIIWVNWSGAIRILERTTLTQKKRHLLQCPHPSRQLLVGCFSQPLDAEALSSQLQRLVVGATAESDSQVGGDATASGTSHAGAVHKIMMALVQGKFAKALGAFAANPIQAYRGPAWEASGSLLAPTPALDSEFDSSDVAATIAAGKHRSSVWISSLASTMAVFAAVAGAIKLWSGEHGAYWAVLELILIALVVTLLWQAKDKQWHSKWIGNRFIAEQLRYTRMGLPLLALTKSLHEASSCVVPDSAGVPRIAMLSKDLRIFQQSVARSGLPIFPSGKPYIAATAESLASLRDYVLSVVVDQVGYHERNHHEHHATQHMLHNFSLSLFCLTGAAVVGHFFLHANWLLIFTAFLPALAAGIHGLTTTLEISRVADQSKATATSLRHLSDAIKDVLSDKSSAWRQWLQLRHLTLMAAEIMSDENSQWQKLVTHQKPKLPA